MKEKYELLEYKHLTRAAILIEPKQPYYNWLKNIDPDFSKKLWMDEPEIYLIPDFEDVSEIEDWLSENYDEIFCWKLNAWYTDDELWIQNRTFEMFKKWFSYKACTMVWDVLPGSIKKV